MKHLLHRWTVAKSLLVVFVALAAFSWSPGVGAQEAAEEGAQFGIRPLDVNGSYFDIEMQAGETRSLAVEVGNFGDVEAEALTYAADAFTLINGGMGVRNLDEPTTGATHWLDYAQESVTLAPDTSITQTFNVTVPADVTPGEYLTTLVIQQAAPSAAENTGEGVTFNTLTRQAIAVAITVPGEMAPALEIGAAAHSTAGGNSVVSFDLTNAGNERAVASGTFTLKDASGAVLTTFDVNLGAIYAGDSTLVEVPFDILLNPGAYSASLTLADETRGVSAEAIDVPLTVEPPAQPSKSGAGESEPNVAVVDQQPETAADPAPDAAPVAAPTAGEASSSGTPIWMLAGGLALALIVGAGSTVGILALVRRRRSEAVPSMTDPAEDPIPVAALEPAPASAPTPVATAVAPEPARAAVTVKPRRLPVMRKLSVPDGRTAGQATHRPISRSVGEPLGD